MASTLSDYKEAISNAAESTVAVSTTTTTTATTLDKETSAKAEANKIVLDLTADVATPSCHHHNNNNNKSNNNNVNKSTIETKVATTTIGVGINNKEEESEKMDNMSNDSSHGIEKYDAPENFNKYEQEDDVTLNPVQRNSHLQYSTMSEEAFIMNLLKENSTTEKSTSDVTETQPRKLSVSNSGQGLSFTIDYPPTNNPSDADAQATRYKLMLERFQNRHKRGVSMSKLETQPTTTNKANMPSNSTADSLPVKENVTLRGRSSSNARGQKDFGKRRSWSPRAFYHNSTTITTTTTTTMTTKKTKNCTDDDQYRRKNLKKPLVFKPRSKCMQKALLEVSNQPLEDDFKTLNLKDGSDLASETGTYVLDGDNYTEEQKAFMNIDENLSPIYDYAILPTPNSISPASLPSPTSDFGCITSVTADGVLNRKGAELELVTNSDVDSFRDAQVLSTVSKKTAWVQEWARNVRARSLANEYVSSQSRQSQPQQQPQMSIMTQSVNLGSLISARDFNDDRLSDTSSAAQCLSYRTAQSKIPSPLHSTRRARSSSRLNSEASSPGETLNLSLRLARSKLVCTDIPQIPRNLMASSLCGLSPEHKRIRERLNSYDGNMQMTLPARSTSNNNFSHMYDYLDDDMDSRPSTGSPVDLSLPQDPVLASHYGKQQQNLARQAVSAPSPLTQARVNKTFLMRREASKSRGNDNNNNNNNNNNSMKPNGIAACPNTPELPRRFAEIKRNNNINTRRSEPRDTKLKLHNEPKSLSIAKKQLLQTAAQNIVTDQQINNLTARVQSAGAAVNMQQQQQKPKYMDISKFKPQQANQFLRKNEARITLKSGSGSGSGSASGNNTQMKRSPSASGLCRSESQRQTNSNVRAAAIPSCMTNSGTVFPGPNSAMTSSLIQSRAQNALTQKDLDMALWKRRSTYDPMRAAAEDRRRKKDLLRQKKDADDTF